MGLVSSVIVEVGLQTDALLMLFLQRYVEERRASSSIFHANCSLGSCFQATWTSRLYPPESTAAGRGPVSTCGGCANENKCLPTSSLSTNAVVWECENGGVAVHRPALWAPSDWSVFQVQFVASWVVHIEDVILIPMCRAVKLIAHVLVECSADMI